MADHPFADEALRSRQAAYGMQGEWEEVLNRLFPENDYFSRMAVSCLCDLIQKRRPTSYETLVTELDLFLPERFSVDDLEKTDWTEEDKSWHREINLEEWTKVKSFIHARFKNNAAYLFSAP